MKPYERRAANAYPYYKLAVWDERNCTWREVKGTFETADRAANACPKGQRGRVSRFNEDGTRADERSIA